MNKTVRILAAAAAVVAIALIGFGVFGGGGFGAPPPSEAPASLTPSPSAAASEAAGPVDFTALAGGTDLEPGEHVITDASPVEVTFTVPDEPFEGHPSAWYKAAYDWGPWHQSHQARLGVVAVESVYADPCAPELGMVNPPVGATVDDLVEALSDMYGMKSSWRDVTVDGYSGQNMQIQGIARPEPCVEEPLVWETTGGEPSLILPNDGDLVTIWILDVEGNRLVIWRAQEGFQESLALRELVDSIQIEVP